MTDYKNEVCKGDISLGTGCGACERCKEFFRAKYEHLPKIDVEFYANIAHEIHSHCVSVGWWDQWPKKTDRRETAYILIVSELAEAMEGDRKNHMDDHLTGYQMFDVELADTVIRLLDWIEAAELNTAEPDEELNDTFYNFVADKIITFERRNFTIPEQLNECVKKLYMHGSIQCLATVIAVAVHNGVDLEKLVRLKFEYNKTREDHKIENRNKEHGKKY